LKNGKLTVAVPLGPEGPPPVQAAAEAIKKALTGETQPPADDEDGESVQAAHDAAAPNDRYAQAADYMDRLEHVMKEQDLWPGDMPAEEIEVKGAFGSENLAFEQWLGWVLIPRVREIVETRGDFPNGSAVAAYAVRAFDGYPNAGPVNDLLFSFDEFVNEMAKS